MSAGTMLPFEEWLKLVREWVRQGEWGKVKASARKRLEAQRRLKDGS
jgi:hypothetical protein